MTLNINETERNFATAILKAVSIREGSYDHATADAETEELEQERAIWERGNPDRMWIGSIDYARFYRITLEEACYEAAAEGPGIAIGRIIFLALYECWNDAIEWANQILDPTATTAPTNKNCQHGFIYKSNDCEGSLDEAHAVSTIDEGESCLLCEKFFKKE